MADHTVEIFKSGTHNMLPAEAILSDASQASENWITQEGKIILAYGRKLIGNDGAVGKITGLYYGYKVDGTKVMYRKVDTKIQYLNGTTWADIITGLTSGSEYTFQNYSSLAGAFTFVGGPDGIWKIIS